MLDTLFSPLVGLDIDALYGRYHTGVDFVLYLFILIVACRAALAKTFPGRHGRSLGTVIGVVLAISLSAVERTLGFTMRSFGPIAAGVVTMAVGLVVYNMTRHVGCGHTAGAATALIVTYFTMRSVMPGFYLWAQGNQWAGYLHALVVLAVLVALWRFISALFGPHEMSVLKRATRAVAPGSDGFARIARREDEAELRTIEGQMKPLTVAGRKECGKLIEALETNRDIVKRHGGDKRATEMVCGALAEIKRRERTVMSELERIKRMDARLLRFDLSEYRDLSKAYKQMNKKQRAVCKRMYAEERHKAEIENNIRRLAARAEAYAVQFDQCIDHTCASLQADSIRDAEGWLERSIEQEHEAEKLLEAIREQEKKLLRLVEKQIYELKAASRQ